MEDEPPKPETSEDSAPDAPAPEGPVLTDAPDAAGGGNPILWLGLMALPLILGLLISLVRGEGPTPNVPQARELPALTGSREAAVEVIAPKVEAYPCEFGEWMGMKVDNDALKAIEVLHRPYRILPPGAMMTMDHSPARVNFDVDQKGIVTRVWCG